MRASSGAPRLLMCLFPILWVLISARDFRVPDTPARGILKLTVTVTDDLSPCSPVLAEEGEDVFVVVKNGGSDSAFVCLTVVRETDSPDGPYLPHIQPLAMVMQASRTDETFIQEGMEYHAVPASQTRNYNFKATQGSYRCTGIKGSNKNLFVFITIIVRDQDQSQRTGDVAATRHSEDQYIAARIDNGQHENVIHHPGLLTEPAAGSDLVAARNEAPGITNLFVLTENQDAQDFHPANNNHVHHHNACQHPTTLINCRAINWSSEDHRRSCLALIVNTVYCGDNNVTTLALSLKNTGFSLHEKPLEDGGHMYAAIYKYDGQVHEDAPDIIVAFRGTQMCLSWSSARDNCFNCIIAVNAVEYTERFKRAYQKVMELIASGEQRVWLTGHSQGASLALHVGRQVMLENEISLSTFAFNPPLAMGCWFPNSAKKFIGTMTPSIGEQFVKLSKWTPVLYVHEKDFLFCRCYIRILTRPTKLDKWVAKLPSAILCQHSSKFQGRVLKRWLGPHSLDQWFKPTYQLKLKCQPVESTDGGDNLNCRAIDEDSMDDIEAAQTNQNQQEAPSQDQHATPTGPSTSTQDYWRPWGILGGCILGITVVLQRVPLMNHLRSGSRRHDSRLPRTSHILDHGWRANMRRMITRPVREHQN